MIGIELNVDLGTIDTIDKDNRKCEECLVELIKVWLRGKRANSGILSAVLQSSHISGKETSVSGKLCCHNNMPEIVTIIVIQCS